MRSLLYVSAGFLAGLLGLTISEWLFSISDIQTIFKFREFILFPVSSIILAFAVVTAEIWLNNPTRYKTNRRIMWQPLSMALLIGGLCGLLAALIFVGIGYWGWIKISTLFAKGLGWCLIGLGAGFADGYSWQYRTIEGGQKSKARNRLILSVTFGLMAALVAFGLSEVIFQSKPDIIAFKDPLGFLVLGTTLGVLLDQLGTNVNSYALRAGMGFESIKGKQDGFPRVSDPAFFNFEIPVEYLPDSVNSSSGGRTDGYKRKIEEGMSIQLIKNKQFTIGSSNDADIFINVLPNECATITLQNRTAQIKAHNGAKILIGGVRLKTGEMFSKELHHNQVLTFYADPKRIQQIYSDSEGNDNEDINPFVRFVFYDRFLDPQS